MNLAYDAKRITTAVIRRSKNAISTIFHRAALDEVGKHTRINWGVAINVASGVRIGSSCLIWNGVSASSESDCHYLRIGDGVQINQGTFLDLSGGIEIRDGVTVSGDCVIYTHDHGLNPRSQPVFSPLVIEKNAWIGIRALILPSCSTIGEGAVIGAGSVVTGDIPNYAVVAGNPARIIGTNESRP